MRSLPRRQVLAALAAFPAFAAAPQPLFAALESQFGGRLGVAALDLGSGAQLHYRASERFPMCSTFKLLLVAAILQRVDRGEERLGRMIRFDRGDLLEYAPVTRAHIGEGRMSIGALCAAAASWSDNTAADLLLNILGGPKALTALIRCFGDTVTRVDRSEPEANTCIPGDPRDTTSPEAMLRDLHRLCFDAILSEASRARLTGWLVDCRTTFPRLAAGLPPGWKSAHKMGTGAYGTANDVAILWPPRRKPVLVACYYTGSPAPKAARDGVLAAVGREVTHRL